MLGEALREESIKRLNRIAGQVEGIRRMIRGERSSIDIIQQLTSAEAALHSLSTVILHDHVSTLVENSFGSCETQDCRGRADEVAGLFEKLRPR